MNENETPAEQPSAVTETPVAAVAETPAAVSAEAPAAAPAEKPAVVALRGPAVAAKAKGANGFLRRFRLATRIWSLVGVAIASVSALAVGGGFVGFVLDEAQDQMTNSAELTELNSQLHIGALQMRRHEKDFLLNNEPARREAYLQVMWEANATLEKIREFPESEPAADSLAKVKTGITQHAAQFEKVFKVQERLGFTADKGLRGQLAVTAAELEETLSMDGFDQLATLVLRMRSEEREFALTGSPKAIAAVEANGAEFIRILAAAPLAPSAKKDVTGRIEGYMRDVKAFAAAVAEQRAAVDKMAADYAAFEPEFDTIASLIGEVAEAARNDFAATQEVAIIAGIALVAFILVVCLATGWLLANSVIHPLSGLTSTIGRLADRDMTVEVTGTEAKDEIGEMARAVGVFKDNLIETDRLQAEQREAEKRAAEDEKKREEEQRAARIERRKAEEQAKEERRQAMLSLADSFEAQVGKVVTEVSGAASQLQTTAEAMSASAEETNRQATAVAAAAEQASANVQTVASAAEELFNSIQEIGRQVAQSSTIAQNAVDEAKKTDAKVQGLAEAAQKIGDVVNLINDIASQTNLLALNATIEAARAGEAGKGFAVVASEVKSLATQTAKATEEIAAQIGAIQGSTGEAVQAIQKIGATITEISEIATAIASAVEEQGAATREIAGNVQQAASGTREVTNNIAGVTQAAGETGQATGQVVSAAGELAEHGALLRAEVDKFLKTVRAA